MQTYKPMRKNLSNEKMRQKILNYLTAIISREILSHIYFLFFYLLFLHVYRFLPKKTWKVTCHGQSITVIKNVQTIFDIYVMISPKTHAKELKATLTVKILRDQLLIHNSSYKVTCRFLNLMCPLGLRLNSTEFAEDLLLPLSL